jgi:hypothetical protein
MQVRHEAMWKQRDEVLRLVKDEMAKSNKKKPEELTQAMWTSVVKSSTLEKNSFWNDKMGSEDLASVKGMAKRIIEEQAREEAGVRPAPHNTNSQAHKLTNEPDLILTDPPVSPPLSTPPASFGSCASSPRTARLRSGRRARST